ncbi:MAG TPA: alpha/beta hydrolase [Methylomirabilota bacterium]|nr:alpha/beta hydrolase [Methylomirabilota bacterium]
MRTFLTLAASLLLAYASFAADPGYTRKEDVVYGRKFGTALTLDVFTPEKQNGAAILFMVSGGFYSAHEAINPAFYKEFLARGYTVFAVVHGSQPRFVIHEITEDIHRAVRFARHNAKQFGVDPQKFGITGASAGGHLTLTLCTQGKPGPAQARDPIDRESSVVQAGACYFPPTDFLNYGKPGEDAVGVGILKDFKGAFGAGAETAESRQAYGKEISPIYFISKSTAPVLIIHGDADKLVPYQQAEVFIEKLKAEGVDAELINRPGKEHGWPDILNDQKILADWFDKHLLGKTAPKQP